jgi:hypothetical protein
MTGVMVRVGDLMFIDTSREPNGLRFLAPSEVGPDPSQYGLDRNMIFEGTIEAAGGDVTDFKLRHRNGGIVDLGVYTIADGYGLAEE